MLVDRRETDAQTRTPGNGSITGRCRRPRAADRNRCLRAFAAGWVVVFQVQLVSEATFLVPGLDRIPCTSCTTQFLKSSHAWFACASTPLPNEIFFLLVLALPIVVAAAWVLFMTAERPTLCARQSLRSMPGYSILVPSFLVRAWRRFFPESLAAA